MGKYLVRATKRVKNVIIHKRPCGYIRGDKDMGHWKEFDTLEEAKVYTQGWEEGGHIVKYCKYCILRM